MLHWQNKVVLATVSLQTDTTGMTSAQLEGTSSTMQRRLRILSSSLYDRTGEYLQKRQLEHVFGPRVSHVSTLLIAKFDANEYIRRDYLKA